MMTKSESTIELSKALAKAQGEIENATKNKTNPHFKSNYADLAAVLGEIRAAFAPNGLSLTQMPFTGEGGLIGVESMLMHSSGEWLCSSISVKPNKTDAPSAGGVITYLRRYSASGIAGIAQEDDDGSTAAGLKPAKPTEIDMQWVAILREKPGRISELDSDINYQTYIKGLL